MFRNVAQNTLHVYLIELCIGKTLEFTLGHSKYYLCFALPYLLGFGPVFEKKKTIYVEKKNALCFFVS